MASHKFMNQMDKRWLMPVVTGLICLIVMILVPPIRQDQAYHGFADTRKIFDIPNFFNVISNAPLMLVGLAGVIRLRAKHASSTLVLYRIYQLIFYGLILTAMGSAYYHYRPDNDRLVWDRLPMTMTFAAFFCLAIAEYISLPTAKRLLPALVIAGMASVVYWHVTEMQGKGDLRPYLLIQFLPLLMIPLILLIYPNKDNQKRYFWAVLGCYALAKLAEALDWQLFLATGLISGHTLKHLMAGLGTWFIYLKLAKSTL